MPAATQEDTATAVPSPAVVVNGPEDGPLDWHSIDWSAHEENVRRLRQRIFKASKNGDLKQVRNLQKLMLRSWSNTLESVRRVTQQSSGRKTAGLDKEVALTPVARARLATELHRSSAPWRARPVRRVYIPKANGKQRPLGIPVIRDRVMQARVKNALEPEWEARFEPRSYGFRPGRSCQDAMTAVYQTAKHKQASRLWVLDADLSAAFDRINHDHLRAAVGLFPARELVWQWLKAGVMERGRFAPTEEGTPQGGVVSPLLMNIALHGMETAAGVQYTVPRKPGPLAQVRTKAHSPVLVRYADDFVVLCATRSEAEAARTRIAEWLRPRGLSLNEEKTSVTHLGQGFDFLGFNFRKYGDTLWVKPSKEAVGRIRKRLSAEVRSLHGSNAPAVVKRLVPIVRGWSAYYRGVVATRTFTALDRHLWLVLWRWALRQHPRKSEFWIKDRYFGKFAKGRQDRWVFGDPATGTHLAKFSWTKIVRHAVVKDSASPDDPELQAYWQDRRQKRALPPMDRTSLLMAHRQEGRCPLCGKSLISDAEPDSPQTWIAWFDAAKRTLHKHHFLVYRCHGGTENPANLRLTHAECHRRHHAVNPAGVGT